MSCNFLLDTMHAWSEQRPISPPICLSLDAMKGRKLAASTCSLFAEGFLTSRQEKPALMYRCMLDQALTVLNKQRPRFSD